MNAALAAALRVEYEIVYGYGIVGSRLRGRDRTIAADRLAAHQLLRDSLLALTFSDADRPAGEPAYRLPFPVTGSMSARMLAIRLEDAAAGAAWDLVAAERPASPARVLAVNALVDAATAAARWRVRAGTSDDPALPGAPPASAQVFSHPSMIPTTSPSPSTTASGSTS